jgi:hypothetical protein
VRGSREEACEATFSVLEVRTDVDSDEGAIFEEVLTKVFNIADLKESLASPDRRSRTSWPSLSSYQLS